MCDDDRMLPETWVQLLDALQTPALAIHDSPISWAELLGDLTGIACVWLVARENIWNWPIGLVNNAFFFVLFFHSKLYGDAVLQVVFGLLGAYGWWQWLRVPAASGALPIRRTSTVEWVCFFLVMLLFTGVVAQWLAANTDSPVPRWDASVLVLSLIATYGQARKLLESWWLWIAVDVISVPLYLNRHLYPTAVLYVVFGILCVLGLRGWRRTFASQSVLPVAA